MSAGQQRLKSGCQTDFAYSMRQAVTNGAPSFFIMSMFRGGDGHCKESKSLVGISMHVNKPPTQAVKQLP